MSDVLDRATSALREETSAPQDADLGLARLDRALADCALGRGTHALRVDALASDATDEEGAAGLARLERALADDGPRAHVDEVEGARALRESTHVARIPADEIEVARLERALVERRASRSRLSRWVVMPIAAALVVMVGWASASGRLAKWISIATHGEQERGEHERSAPQNTGATQPRSAAKPPVPSADPALPPLPAPDDSTSALPTPSELPSAPPSTIAVAPSAARSPSLDGDALYRAAHEAHFVKKDPAAALAAWDRYLAAAPHGRFALEAKYNRAISLVRLGRRAEAAAALRPFASGDYGGYRKEEARELLQTLE